MSTIVYQHDKRINVTYAYESVSYYDKDKKQSRAKRRLIGRVENGEIIPTSGKRGRPRSESSERIEIPASFEEKCKDLKQKLLEKDNQISSLQKQVSALEKENRQFRNLLDRIHSISAIQE